MDVASEKFQSIVERPKYEKQILFLAGVLGVLILISRIAVFIKWIWVTFLRPEKDLRKYGSWAIVTGPTDGIGKGFVFELARRKMNLVLVGRNPTKLNELADELQDRFKIQAKQVLVDFAGDLDEGVKRVEDAISELEVGLLVNNVGISYPYARFFHEVDDLLLMNLIKINVEGTSKMVKTVIPGMLRRRKGAILNLGSGGASIIPSAPLYAVYVGTKAYIDQFSRTLYVEYKHSGIDVQCQVPLYVATKMAPFKKASLLVPSPETYARAALRWVGYEPRCTPYWAHSVLWWLATVLPEPLVDAYRLKFSLNIRKRGQLKDAGKED